MLSYRLHIEDWQVTVDDAQLIIEATAQDRLAWAMDNGAAQEVMAIIQVCPDPLTDTAEMRRAGHAIMPSPCPW